MFSSQYVDRGIIKWSAFDALVGYHSMLEEMKYRLGKKEKPILSEDEQEELNRSLQEAVRLNSEIELKYYRDGYLRFTYGTIEKINYQSRVIVLSTKEKFNAEDIIEIQLS